MRVKRKRQAFQSHDPCPSQTLNQSQNLIYSQVGTDASCIGWISSPHQFPWLDSTEFHCPLTQIVSIFWTG